MRRRRKAGPDNPASLSHVAEAVSQRGFCPGRFSTIRGCRRTSLRVVVSRGFCCRRMSGIGLPPDHLAWFVIDAVEELGSWGVLCGLPGGWSWPGGV